MAFGRRKSKDEPADEPEVRSIGRTPEPERSVENAAADDFEGPFDIEDFDDAAAAEAGRLDLGSVLLPMPAVGPAASRADRDGHPQRGMGGDSPTVASPSLLTRRPRPAVCGARWPVSWPTRCARTGPR